MSRIFDALNEAARLRGNLDATESLWAELGINPASLPEEEKRGNARRLTISTPEPVEAPERVQIAVEPPPQEKSPELLEWTLTRTVLDKEARLLPHTPDPIVVEHYRMLRNKLLLERDKKFFKSLVVTSASPREGKTVTTVNLGMTMAALSSMRVLLVDGDLRRGSLGQWLGIDPGRPGLGNILNGSATLNDVLLKIDDLSMCVLPSGNAPIGELEQSQIDVLLKTLNRHFDLILVDSPPTNLISDVVTLAGACDAVLLVARAFATTTKSLEEAAEKLHMFRIVGSVLNGGTPPRSRKYRGYY